MKDNSIKNISIIIPTFNEEKNVKPLVEKIHKALSKEKINYELIFVDDHSTDQTQNIISNLSIFYPIISIQKRGKKGKAYSIVEGIQFSQYENIAMIDADLQYPPEAFPGMIKALKSADVVVANRKNYKDTKTRKFLSKGYRKVFGKALFGLDHDIQSGLKVFTRQAYETVKFKPNSAWTFDLEFLHRVRQAGFEIKDYDITFSKRKNGDSKVGTVKQSFEIGTNALRVFTKRIHPAHIPPSQDNSMIGAGVGHKKKKYITHTTIPHARTALRTANSSQKLIILLLVIIAALGFYNFPLNTLKTIVAVLSAIYFFDVLFNFYLITKSINNTNEIVSSDEEIEKLKDKDLPIYTILCPLYKEALIIPQFLEAIEKISWPKDKLDVILLFEEDDKETLDLVSKMKLPSYIRNLVVPRSNPKTKPKACNYGLAHARGSYLVVYDAEDIPDPLQLKKAFLGFKKADKDVICLQAKLNYYNKHQNLLTRFFTAEYSLWFDLTLPGLVSINTSLPLGGTSNHFKITSLIAVEGWDPFNVTEDADLGIRLFNKGYKTAMIDSETLEEANSKVGNWFRQRSRWIKGYMQTYLVHTRSNTDNNGGKSPHHGLIFHLIIGGKLAFVLINPILWLATLAYFALYSYVGPAIEALYPSIVFYMAIFSLVFGNFLFLYYYMLGVAKKGQWNLVKFVFLIPIYWIMLSISAYYALYQLIFKPHYWEKTVHGFHLQKKKEEVKAVEVIEEPTVAPAGRRLAFPTFGFSSYFLTSKNKISSSLFGDLTSGMGLVIFASLIANGFNLLYSVFLARTKIINLEEFGLIVLIGSILIIAQIPLQGFAKTISHRSAYLSGKYKTPIRSFWEKLRRVMIIPSVLLTLLWLALIPILSQAFHIDSYLPLLLITPVWSVFLFAAVDAGFLRGNLHLKTVALMLLAEVVSKFSLTVLIVQLGYSEYIYVAIPASIIISFTIGWIAAKRIPKEKIKIDISDINYFPKKFYASTILTKLSNVAFVNVDILLAKHYLPPAEAGLYAVLSLVGKMVYFLGTLFTQFMTPIISREEGAGKDSKHIFTKLMIGSILSVSVGVIFFGILGSLTVPLVLGDKSLAILQFLPFYTIAMGCIAIGNGIVSYHQAKQAHLFAVAGFIFSYLALSSIIFYHESIGQIITVISIAGISYLALMIFLHLTANHIKSFITDFALIFNTKTKNTEININENKSRILIFNWRDTKHVWAGGAETYIQELASRWVSNGHTVTIFCGNDRKAKRNDKIDGINIVRRGGTYTVYAWAFVYYLVRFRGKFDIIIDSENGIPFFTPLFTRTPAYLLIHHIHQEVFRLHLIAPLSFIAKFLEAKIMPKVYRNNQIITVSQSSKKDILKLGFNKNNISIIHPGHKIKFNNKIKKSSLPVFVYLGRLKPYKNVDIAIKAFSKVVKNYPKARLQIIGEGESLEKLLNITKELGLEKNIIFMGHVSDAKKTYLLSKSWVVIQPSMIEGWGITVIEANASRTPVIASNVSGLRDSVADGKTGMLIEVNDINGFANAMRKFIKNKKLRNTFSDNAYDWSRNFNWDESAEILIKLFEVELKKSPAININKLAFEKQLTEQDSI